MLSEIYVMTVSDFRKSTAQAIREVDKNLNHIWLKRHNRMVGAFIPMRDVDVLASIQGRDLVEVVRRLKDQHRAMTDGAMRQDEIRMQMIADKEWKSYLVQPLVAPMGRR